MATTDGLGIAAAIRKPLFNEFKSGVSAPVLVIRSAAFEPPADDVHQLPSTFLATSCPAVNLASSVHSAVMPAASMSPHAVCWVGYEFSGIVNSANPGRLNPLLAMPVPSPPKLGGGP